jgi:penicillin-binding protein 2
MYARDGDRTKLFNRRAAILGGLKLSLFSVLAGRMYYLQVLESARYATLADENRISLRLLAPPRGRIVDRFGQPLAINQENFRVLVVPEQAINLESTLESLSYLIPLSEHERQRIIREAKRKRRFVPVTVRENLSWEDVARIEFNAPDLPGVLLDVGQSRFYPHGEKLAHVLGYVAPVSETDQTAGDPLLELPGFRIGRAGMERVHDSMLRGRGGNSQVEVNAFGRVIRELARFEGEPGAEIALTLDMQLQEYAFQRLGEQSAACVVMDVRSGELIVMASTPAYDPNAFAQGLSADQWKELTNNQRAPLTNKCIAGQYAPGSTFKMVVAMAALESGLVSPDFRVGCSGWIELGNARFHCWKKGGQGGVDLYRGLAHSCDIYFYEIAKRIGIDRISEMARRFGLGQNLGLELPGEKIGLMPTRAWKQKMFKAPWAQGETLVAGIGQGYVLSTPLQLAVMTARFANGGLAVVPRITRQVGDHSRFNLPSENDWPSIGVSRNHLNLVRKGMKAVVNEPGGTAYSARIMEPEWAMAGKTGTAQVRRITQRERETGVRKNEDLPWKERDHAMFVAYAPEENPRYAITVIVEHGGGGSAVAAPIARDVLRETLRRDPSGSRERRA